MRLSPPEIIDANNAFFRVASIDDYVRGQISEIFLCASPQAKVA